VTEIPTVVEAELARLRAENARLLLLLLLRRLLKMTPRQAAPPGPGAGRVLRRASRHGG
jgi:hypothetical protein